MHIPEQDKRLTTLDRTRNILYIHGGHTVPRALPNLQHA